MVDCLSDEKGYIISLYLLFYNDNPWRANKPLVRVMNYFISQISQAHIWQPLSIQAGAF